MKILFLSDELSFVSGVSKHLYYFLSELAKDNEYEIILVCPGGDFIHEFEKLN